MHRRTHPSAAPPATLHPSILVTLLWSASSLLACSAGDEPNSRPSARTGGSGTGATGTGGNGTSGTGTGGAGTGGAGALGTGGSGTDGDVGTGGAARDCGKSGFYVESGKLYDAKCNEFIMRGVNYPYAWYSERQDTASQFADIAGTGANTVRVVMSTGGHGAGWPETTAAEVGQIIAWAEANQLVAMLELHDATGYGEKIEAQDPRELVDYWLKSDIRAQIDGHEDTVIINIANEPIGNVAEIAPGVTWEALHVAAVQDLRSAGLKHTLVVDAPNWGQDWEHTMRDGSGKTNIFNADPDKNVVFSIHMYMVYDQASIVTTYFDQFGTSLPLIVGEFAADHGSDGDVAEGAILDECVSRGIGYLGWSWSGNGGGLESLDICENFNIANLTTWGGILINDPSGIQSTSQTCSVFP